MNEYRENALEVFTSMMVNDSKVIKIGGELTRYMINRQGIVWTVPYTKVRPYFDSKTGFLTVSIIISPEKIYEKPLQELIAEAYIPNDQGYVSARLKGGDPTQLTSYTINNIEWYMDETEAEEVSEDEFNFDKEKDIANIIWCRRRQGFPELRIAKELGMEINMVIDLIAKYDPQFMSDFQFSKDPKTTRIKKFKCIRPFIAYLVNLGLSVSNVAEQIRLLVPEADSKQIKSTIRISRKGDPRVKPEYRCK